jgi:multiple sugar transport system permease protein
MTADRWRTGALAPALLVYLALAVLPVLNLMAMSVHDIRWEQGAPHWSFVGLKHFRDLPADPLIRAGTFNTVLFALLAVSIEMVIGLALALAVSRVQRGRVAYRTIFLLPILIPGIVIGAIWKLLYNPDFGAINQVFALVGIAPQDWLGSAKLAFASVVVVDVWHWTPFVFLLMLAGAESLPQDLYEAARVDGATVWQELRHVTLPLLVPTIVIAFVFRLIVSFKVFDEVYLLTGGGPGTATEVLSFSIYRRFFTEDRAGFGSALSLAVLFALTLAVVLAHAASRRHQAIALGRG